MSTRAVGTKKLWCKESIKIVKSIFLTRAIKGIKSDGNEILEIIKNNESLEGRTVSQIRAFLQYLVKKSKNESNKRKRSSSPENVIKRNCIPNSIYVHFAKFIEKQELLTIKDVSEAYELSPTFQKYNPREIHNLVQKVLDME